ncbi:MAG: hypothetical protein P1T08_18395 [Acidimicrobiia bacterium]|nr:hypothetical protein [Acidimicrobiia bacterium]
MPTRSKVLILLAAVLFVVATTSVASADHGYWSKHQHVIGEPSGSDYSAYAVVDAADALSRAILMSSLVAIGGPRWWPRKVLVF